MVKTKKNTQQYFFWFFTFYLCLVIKTQKTLTLTTTWYILYTYFLTFKFWYIQPFKRMFLRK